MLENILLKNIFRKRCSFSVSAAAKKRFLVLRFDVIVWRDSSCCLCYYKSSMFRFWREKGLIMFDTKTFWVASNNTAWKVSKYGIFSSPYFPVFGLNTEIYCINLRIQSEYGKIKTRKYSVFGHFLHSVNVFLIVRRNILNKRGLQGLEWVRVVHFLPTTAIFKISRIAWNFESSFGILNKIFIETLGTSKFPIWHIWKDQFQKVTTI